MPQEADRLKRRALDAIQTALDTHNAARNKYNSVIARKDVEGISARSEEAKVAALDVQIGNLETERTEYRAANVVTSAPTREEITAAQGSISAIKQMAIGDASVASGQATITSLLKASLDLKTQNAKA